MRNDASSAAQSAANVGLSSLHPTGYGGRDNGGQSSDVAGARYEPISIPLTADDIARIQRDTDELLRESMLGKEVLRYVLTLDMRTKLMIYIGVVSQVKDELGLPVYEDLVDYLRDQLAQVEAYYARL